ncbi:hypothetical protein [Butyrivibrio sp. AE3004]|uniref:hypothetical protein n=1 Tax=Butyrivibrio sp. AE3004 TaxID=1506994 RepID=UPI000494B983|nr:hypothetical protein [Butyrivibrio sp. AE3004]
MNKKKKGESAVSVPEKLYRIFISFLFWAVCAFLLFISVYNTCQVDNNEVTYFFKGNILSNIAAIIIVIAVLFVFCKTGIQNFLSQKLDSNDFFRGMTKGILLLAIILFSLLFVLTGGTDPVSDQAFVQNAAYNINAGDYSDLLPGGYLFTYPNQLGLVWISILFGKVFGFGNYMTFRLINVMFIGLFYKRISDITGMINEKRRFNEITVLFLGILFYPLIMYCTFVYGTIPGLALSASAIYHALKFYKDKLPVNAAMSAICITLAMLFKNNYLIVFIAIFIQSMVYLLGHRKKALSVLPILLIASYLIQAFLPTALTKIATGMDAPKGASPISWIAMGLQDGGLAEGWYNGYNTDTFRDFEYDKELQANAAKENIQERIGYFKENRFDCFRFFSRKLASEWNDPTFESYWINRPVGERTSSIGISTVLLGNEGIWMGIVFLDHLQVFILLGAFLYVIIKQDKSEADLILVLTFIGGFLFHIFWEAKPQYTLTYFALLLPLCVSGFSELFFFIENIFSKNKHKRPSGGRKIWVLMLFALPIIMLLTLYSGSVGNSLTEDGVLTSEFVNR